MYCLRCLWYFVSALEFAHLDWLNRREALGVTEPVAAHLLVLGVSRCWKSQGLGTPHLSVLGAEWKAGVEITSSGFGDAYLPAPGA